ncbi:MAG: hypothetical protein LAT64_03190 [Phycisphaerales bacterium]|nr:hypothetical protein [Planctomycetota bacterium]MCH8507761.1 hypothetical protein [Phycisphaerales bacterium]
MKRIASLFTLCLAGSVAMGWPAFNAALLVNQAAPAPQATVAAPVAAEPEGGDVGADFPLCLFGFSKDDCHGVVQPGEYKVSRCDLTGCQTIIVTGAVYETRFQSSGLPCGVICETLCDEFPDGRFILKFDYVLRGDSCCPYRGSWHGEWSYTVPGRVFEGRAHGTIGVGTNRASACPVTHDGCEPCYDVRLNDDGWYIGFEGSFRGTATSSVLPHQEDLHFTMDGTWIIDPTSARPFTAPFRVRNRFDGTHLRWACP